MNPLPMSVFFSVGALCAAQARMAALPKEEKPTDEAAARRAIEAHYATAAEPETVA